MAILQWVAAWTGADKVIYIFHIGIKRGNFEEWRDIKGLVSRISMLGVS